MSDNHFITVSKRGVLMARRKGQAPVAVATSSQGLNVQTAGEVAGEVRVFFAPGGKNRVILITAVQVDGGELFDPDEFLARFGVSEGQLASWIRAAVEQALDR